MHVRINGHANAWKLPLGVPLLQSGSGKCTRAHAYVPSAQANGPLSGACTQLFSCVIARAFPGGLAAAANGEKRAG
jgi:hypothetical protein